MNKTTAETTRGILKMKAARPAKTFSNESIAWVIVSSGEESGGEMRQERDMEADIEN